MKKILLFSLLFSMLVIGIQAQSLVLFDGNTPLENGTELLVLSSVTHDPVELALTVTNTGSIGMDVTLKRTDLFLVDSTDASFCWGTNCYPPFVIESPEAVRIDVGASNTSFRGDYTHGGHTGTSRVLYSFFDASNPADSTWVIVNFQVVVIADLSFELAYDDGVLTNNQEISVLSEPAHDPVEVSLLVKNTNTVPVTVKVKKYDLNLMNNTSSNICWGIQCYPPDVNTTPEAVVIESNESNGSFRGDYTHGGLQGASKVMYTFFNVDNPNDSISFVVNYIVGYLGVNDVVINSAQVSNAYPNPAKNVVNFDYKLPASVNTARIKINNLLGTTVRDFTLENNEGKAVIDISNFKDGIYFYSLILNNSATTTRKFIVKR